MSKYLDIVEAKSEALKLSADIVSITKETKTKTKKKVIVFHVFEGLPSFLNHNEESLFSGTQAQLRPKKFKV